VRHLQSIDGLRGIFALLVVFYHTSYWLHIPYSDWIMSVFRIWGIYGVEGFFVISGIALTLSTKPKQFNSLRGCFIFIGRRYSRILPLYALLFFFYRRSFDLAGQQWTELAMLFGFIDPAQATLIAGWSIGVEFTFYFLFPLLVLLCRDGIYRSGFITILAAIVLAWYSTSFDSEVSLGSQNSIYVNPVNHFLFFVSGYFLGAIYKAINDSSIMRTNTHSLVVLCATIFALICLLGLNSDQVELVVGYKRFVLSLMLIITVGVAMYINVSNRVSAFLGNISYAIYLLYPVIVFMVLPRFHLENPWIKFIFVLILVVPLSYLSHRFWEMPAQRFIRRVAHA